MQIVVTGGSGYIGARLVRTLAARGARVTVLARRPLLAAPGVVHRPWSLGEEVPAGALDGVHAVIHLAHQWNSAGPLAEDVNVTGTRLLITAARAAGVDRFVFASTVSARSDALNRYGRLKAAIEGELTAPGEVAARIGLVYGGPALSQWGTLLRLTRLPVLPMLDPGKAVQPIHLDELCDGLCRLALSPVAPTRRVYGLAAATTVSFGVFLKATARLKHGKGLPILPVPSPLALALVDAAAKVPGLPRVDRERILGMMGLPVVDSRDGLAELGLALRPLEAGLAPEPHELRRRLLAEGMALTGAVLGRHPGIGSLRRYARGVADFDGGTPIALPPLAARLPLVVAACEPVGRPESRLARRLALATRVVEATPEGAALTHPAGGRGAIATLARLAAIGLREALLMPLRLVLGRRW